MKYNKIFIFSLLLLIPVSNVFGQDSETVEESEYILTLYTENSKYLQGQVPVIFGTIFNSNAEPVTAKINIQIFDKENIIYEASTLAKDGKFRYVGFSSNSVGEFIVKVTLDENTDAMTKITIGKIQETKLGQGAMLTVSAIVALLILIGIMTVKGKVTLTEPIRFALLTLCSIIPIVTLVAIDVQIGQDGIAGLVLQELSEKSIEACAQNSLSVSAPDVTQTNHFHWVMHFGGNVHDNFQSGIVVPTYILFFGMIGGYLRFLYKTQRGWFIQRAIYEIGRTSTGLGIKTLKQKAKEAFEKAESEKSNEALEKRIIFNNSMEDLSLIFLPPILAVASYFLLLQGGVNPCEGWPTFAVVSFAIGLISNELIHKLESFARSTIDSNGALSGSPKPGEDDEQEENNNEGKQGDDKPESAKANNA